MIINRPQAKQAAKDCMRTAQVSPYQIGALYIVIILAMSIFESFITVFLGENSISSPLYWFVAILISLISVTLAAGLSTYCLGIRRGRYMPITTLFDGFYIVGKIIILELVMNIFIMLWSMLFVIPGIIAMYRYRFALYNLLENPDLGIMEAINMSKAQTAGFKWQLFVLDLSFIGWTILYSLTFCILGIWLLPYMTLTDLAYYDAICEFKGMSTQSGNWYNGNSDHQQSYTQGQYDYDWNHQNNNWNSVEHDGSTQEQTPPPSLNEKSPFPQDSPKAPDVPDSSEPWQKKNDSDPWNRNNDQQ